VPFRSLPSTDLPALEADGDALVTLIRNLLDNALKYSGGEAHRSASGNARRFVCIEVEDNGAGFSRKVGRRIFDRFFQGDRSGSGNAGGAGLASASSSQSSRPTRVESPSAVSRAKAAASRLAAVPDGG